MYASKVRANTVFNNESIGTPKGTPKGNPKGNFSNKKPQYIPYNSNISYVSPKPYVKNKVLNLDVKTYLDKNKDKLPTSDPVNVDVDGLFFSPNYMVNYVNELFDKCIAENNVGSFGDIKQSITEKMRVKNSSNSNVLIDEKMRVKDYSNSDVLVDEIVMVYEELPVFAHLLTDNITLVNNSKNFSKIQVQAFIAHRFRVLYTIFGACEGFFNGHTTKKSIYAQKVASCVKAFFQAIFIASQPFLKRCYMKEVEHFTRNKTGELKIYNESQKTEKGTLLSDGFNSFGSSGLFNYNSDINLYIFSPFQDTFNFGLVESLLLSHSYSDIANAPSNIKRAFEASQLYISEIFKNPLNSSVAIKATIDIRVMCEYIVRLYSSMKNSCYIVGSLVKLLRIVNTKPRDLINKWNSELLELFKQHSNTYTEDLDQRISEKVDELVQLCENLIASQPNNRIEFNENFICFFRVAEEENLAHTGNYQDNNINNIINTINDRINQFL